MDLDEACPTDSVQAPVKLMETERRDDNASNEPPSISVKEFRNVIKDFAQKIQHWSNSAQDTQSEKADISNGEIHGFLTTQNISDLAIQLGTTAGGSNVKACWKELNEFVSDLISAIKREENSHRDKLAKILVKLVKLMGQVVNSFTASEHVAIQKIMYPSIKLFHDEILRNDFGSKELQKSAEVATICEKWYTSDLYEKDTVILNAFNLVLDEILNSDGKGSVKRLYDIRSVLDLIYFNDQSSIDIRKKLVNSLISNLLLTSKQGRKFLAKVLSSNFSDEFLATSHKMIKRQLVYAKKNLIACYGDIYYHAWKNIYTEEKGDAKSNHVLSQATDQSMSLLAKFEETVVLDLFTATCLTQHDILREKILALLESAFHKNKKEVEIERMLSRVYEGRIFSFLECTNPLVRRNAIQVLSRAFPLRSVISNEEDKSISLNQNDEMIERQLVILEELLSDDHELVRVEAINAFSIVLFRFWELFSHQKIVKILSKQANDLLFDKSSFWVRAAVLEGFEMLSDNPIAQPVLKNLFQGLRAYNILADKSPRVRKSMIKLLCALENKSFFDIKEMVEVRDIVGALESETHPSLVIKLSQLSAPYFCPQHVSLQDKLASFLELQHMSPAATVKLSQCILKLESISTVVKLIIVLAKNMEQRLEVIKSVLKAKDVLSINDKALSFITLEGTLHTIATLWEAIAPELLRPEGKSLQTKLNENVSYQSFIKAYFGFIFGKKFGSYAEIILNELTKKRSNLTTAILRERIKTPLLQIASNMEPNSELMDNMMTNLTCFKFNISLFSSFENDLAQFQIYLSAEARCLISWGKLSELITLIHASSIVDPHLIPCLLRFILDEDPKILFTLFSDTKATEDLFGMMLSRINHSKSSSTKENIEPKLKKIKKAKNPSNRAKEDQPTCLKASCEIYVELYLRAFISFACLRGVGGNISYFNDLLVSLLETSNAMREDELAGIFNSILLGIIEMSKLGIDIDCFKQNLRKYIDTQQVNNSSRTNVADQEAFSSFLQRKVEALLRTDLVPSIVA